MDGTISNPMEENAAFDRKEFDWHSIATDIAKSVPASYPISKRCRAKKGISSSKKRRSKLLFHSRPSSRSRSC